MRPTPEEIEQAIKDFRCRFQSTVPRYDPFSTSRRFDDDLPSDLETDVVIAGLEKDWPFADGLEQNTKDTIRTLRRHRKALSPELVKEMEALVWHYRYRTERLFRIRHWVKVLGFYLTHPGLVRHLRNFKWAWRGPTDMLSPR